MTKIDRDLKATILREAEGYHQKKWRWIQDPEGYHHVMPPAGAITEYQGRDEPVLSTVRGETWNLSVNNYDAVVLNSSTLFIADIDELGRTPNDYLYRGSYARVRGQDDLLERLHRLPELDRSLPLDQTRFSRETYLVYRTYAGYRVISPTIEIDRDLLDPHHDRHFTIRRLFDWIGTDPRYLEMCRQQRCCRARLTSKPWRFHDGEPTHVCDLVTTIGPSFDETDHAERVRQVRLHHMMTAREVVVSGLA